MATFMTAAVRTSNPTQICLIKQNSSPCQSLDQIPGLLSRCTACPAGSLCRRVRGSDATNYCGISYDSDQGRCLRLNEKDILCDQWGCHDITKLKKTKLHGLSPRANYTDRATAACRRSDCQLVRIEGATRSA
jgi:hypothetical protein